MAEPPPPPTPLTAMIREVFSTLGPFTSASNGAGAAASSNGAHSAMASVDATEVMAVDGGNDDDNDPLGLASLMDDDVNHEEHDGHAISGENNAENGQIPADKNVVVGDDAIGNGDSSNSANTSTSANSTTATTPTTTTSPKTTTRLNRALVADLITASLKLYQDNYRLKKFFGNFKQYVGSYAEAATASESPAAKDISTISQKFITNLSAVHESLFNDSASLKRLMDRFNFSEYQSTVQDSWASENDPLIAGPSTSTSAAAGATTSDAPEAPTGRCAVALANYLFSKAQRNAARLEHDPVYREILLDSILGPASSQPSSSSSNDSSMVKEHALRTRSSRSSSSSSSAFTATLPSSYACHSCGGRFPYLDSLLSHLKREHDAPYQCFQCSLRFPSRILLNKHLESGKCNIGGDLPVRVRPLPANLFGKKRGRKPKEKVDLPPEVFTKVASKGTQTGPYGGKPGDRPLTQEEEGGATTYICPYCKIIFKRPINLSAHIKGVHVGDPGYAAAAAQVSLSEEVQELLAESEDENEAAGKKKKEGNPKAYLCRLCSRHFSRSIFLVDHIRAFHTENVCVSCNRQFKVRSTLNRHIKESDCARTAALPAIPTFSCGFCSIAPFKRIAHLNQHILRKHSADPSLEIVVEPFNGGNIKPADLFPEELERLEVAVECRTCSLTFQRMTPFLTHLQAEHRAPEVGGAGLKCPHCKKTFKTRPSMATHVRESKCFRTEKLTGHMRPHRCRVCNKGFKLAPHLNLHMKNLHGWSKEGESGKKPRKKKKMANGKEEGEGDKEGANGGNGDEGEEEEEGVPEGVETAFQEGDVEVILEEEGAASTAPKEKKKKKRAPSNRLYKCTWLACDFVSGDSLQVDEHRKVVHLGWKEDAGVFSCVYCSGGNLTFPDTESVLAHLNKSHRARYKCNFNNGACQFQTGSLRELREHKASRHVKIRGFTCDWPDCTKVYVSPSLVAHHMRTAHKNERLLPCSWPGCGESFKKPLNLKNHLASHTTATAAARSSTRRRRNETYAEQSGSEGTSGEMESAVSSILGGGGGGHSSSMTASASTSMMNQQQQPNQFQGFQTFNYDGQTTTFNRPNQPSVTVVYNNTTGSNNSSQQYLQPNSQLLQQQQQQQTLGLQQSNQLFTNQQQQQQLQQMQQMLAGNHSLQALAQSHGSNVTSTAFQYLQQQQQQQQQQSTGFSYQQQSSNMGGKSAGAAFSNSSNRAGGSQQQLLHHCTLNGCTATFSDVASLNRHAEAVHLFSLITDSGMTTRHSSRLSQ